MRADLARFTPSSKPPYTVYLTALLPNGDRVPDPLVNHVNDFFIAGYNEQVDPRLPAAIAGAETTFGTMNVTWDKNNNPFGLEPKLTPYVTVVDSIDAVSRQLALYVYRDNCLTIPELLNHCHYCVAGCQDWIKNVTCHYGSCPINLGGDPNPNTQDLTFSEACSFGDCDGDGQTDVSELITLVNIALGDLPVSDCLAGADNSSCPSGAGGAGAGAAEGARTTRTTGSFALSRST